MKSLFDPKIYSTLENFGLTTMEVTVYLSALELGCTQASIVSRRLNLNRSTTRYTLENLVKKRVIVQSKKNNTFYFTAENPEKIIMLLRDKQAKLQTQEQGVQKILGDLKSLQNPYSKAPKVQFFEGVDGLISMYEDVLKESRENQVIIYGCAQTNAQNISPEIWEYINNVYIPERKKIRNPSFMLFPDTSENDYYLSHDKTMNRTSLLIPEKEFPFKTAMHIYGSKVAFYSRQKNEAKSGIIIEHNQIQRDQFILFKMAWQLALTFEQNQHYKSVSLLASE